MAWIPKEAAISTLSARSSIKTPIETVCSLIGFFILILGIFGLLNHFVLDTESSSTLVLGVSMIGVLLGIHKNTFFWNNLILI